MTTERISSDMHGMVYQGELTQEEQSLLEALISQRCARARAAANWPLLPTGHNGKTSRKPRRVGIYA